MEGGLPKCHARTVTRDSSELEVLPQILMLFDRTAAPGYQPDDLERLYFGQEITWLT